MKSALILILCHIYLSEASLVGWLLGRDNSPFIPFNSDKNFDNLMSKTEDKDETKHIDSDNSLQESPSKIPFELSVADEKFIADAQKYTDLKLSELDVCQHKVSFITVIN